MAGTAAGASRRRLGALAHFELEAAVAGAEGIASRSWRERGAARVLAVDLFDAERTCRGVCARRRAARAPRRSAFARSCAAGKVTGACRRCRGRARARRRPARRCAPATRRGFSARASASSRDFARPRQQPAERVGRIDRRQHERGAPGAGLCARAGDRPRRRSANCAPPRPLDEVAAADLAGFFHRAQHGVGRGEAAGQVLERGDLARHDAVALEQLGRACVRARGVGDRRARAVRRPATSGRRWRARARGRARAGSCS